MSLCVFMSIALFSKFDSLFLHLIPKSIITSVQPYSSSQPIICLPSPKDRQLARTRERSPLRCYRRYQPCDILTESTEHLQPQTTL